MKKIFIILLFSKSLFLLSQEETISTPIIEKESKYDIEINYGISFPGKDIHTNSWEDNFSSYSKPGVDIRTSFLLKIWKNAGVFVAYHYLNNDFDFDIILKKFSEKSDVYEWSGTHSEWYHHTLYFGISTEIPLSKKFNLNLRIQPGLSYSTSPDYKVVGQNKSDKNDFYIYQQFYDNSLAFALTSGLGVKFSITKLFYTSLRSDLSFFSPKFEIDVNNNGRQYYKDYTPYITSFSISAGVGVKF